MLRLTTFGGLAISRDGIALTGAAAQRSRLSLLALLATSGPTGFSRDKLLLHLWPESDEERARHALKQAVYSLRRELGSDEVIVGTAALSLNPLIITSDTREFEAAIAAGDLATAVSLYAGPFLDGFHLKDSAEFERWSDEQRARFAHMWVSSVEKLAAERQARGAWREAAGYWRTLAASEPLSGRRALALIRCLAESGDLGAALQQYKVHEALLREEIGSAPEAAVSSFAESLRAGTWTRSPEPKVPLPPLVLATGSGGVALAEAVAAPQPMVAGWSAAPGAPPQRQSIGGLRKRRRRTTAVAFVLGVLLMAALALTVSLTTMDPDRRAALGFVLGRPDPVLNPRRIVVAQFENKTNDSTLDVLGDQIASWFARELSESDFDVVDERTARAAAEVIKSIAVPLRNRNEDIALGEETGAGYTVVGSYFHQGDSLQADVRVVDVKAKRTVKRLGPFYGTANDPRALIKAIYQPTLVHLATAVDTTAGGQTAKYLDPPSLEAFRRVSSAWQHFFENSRDTVSVFAELDTAARLDPTYAAPLLMKAYMLDVKSQWAQVNQIVQRARPLTPNMSKLEHAGFELFEADLQGRALDRVELARRMQPLSPASGEFPLLRVVSALYVGNIAEAQAALKTIDPTRGMNVGSPAFLEWSATVYHHSGQASLEEKAVREELDRFRHHPPSTVQLVRIYAARNDKRLAEALSKGIPPAKNPTEVRDPVAGRMDLRMLAGRELRAHGYPDEAKRVFTELAEELKASSDSSLDFARRRAQVLYELGDFRNSLVAFTRVLQRDTTDLEAMARIATSSIRLGDSATARQMDQRLTGLKVPFLMGAPLRWRATIAAAQNKPEEAMALLESAVRQGHRLLDTAPNLTVHLDPEFVGVETWASYKSMLQTLAGASTAK